MKFELSFTNKEVTPITSIWCGVNRFLYTEVTRADKVLWLISDSEAETLLLQTIS